MPEFPNLSASCRKAIARPLDQIDDRFPVGAQIETGSQLMRPR
jgi:hypothetical protein